LVFLEDILLTARNAGLRPLLHRGMAQRRVPTTLRRPAPGSGRAIMTRTLWTPAPTIPECPSVGKCRANTHREVDTAAGVL